MTNRNFKTSLLVKFVLVVLLGIVQANSGTYIKLEKVKGNYTNHTLVLEETNSYDFKAGERFSVQDDKDNRRIIIYTGQERYVQASYNTEVTGSRDVLDLEVGKEFFRWRVIR